MFGAVHCSMNPKQLNPACSDLRRRTLLKSDQQGLNLGMGLWSSVPRVPDVLRVLVAAPSTYLPGAASCGTNVVSSKPSDPNIDFGRELHLFSPKSPLILRHRDASTAASISCYRMSLAVSCLSSTRYSYPVAA